MMKRDETKSAPLWTSIRLREDTVVRIAALGRKGETYDTIVVWLLANCKKKR